ncbi:MAG: universal stress protein [Chloroflexota bacterium]
MYRSILVPLDGSRRAEAILPHVEDMAHRYEARIIFLQVLEPAPVIVGPYDAEAFFYQPEEMEERQKEVDAYLAGLEGEFREKGIASKRIVAQGPVVQSIIDVAEREDADLIAMASHGRGGLTRVFYGSVAAGVLQRVDRPLLLIRAGED